MKKLHYIIGGCLIILTAGTTLAVQSILPTRVEIQEDLYNTSNGRVHKLANEIKIQQHNLAQLQKEADNAFCLLVDLKRADGIKVQSAESITRYNTICHKLEEPQAFQK